MQILNEVSVWWLKTGVFVLWLSSTWINRRRYIHWNHCRRHRWAFSFCSSQSKKPNTWSSTALCLGSWLQLCVLTVLPVWPFEVCLSLRVFYMLCVSDENHHGRFAHTPFLVCPVGLSCCLYFSQAQEMLQGDERERLQSHRWAHHAHALGIHILWGQGFWSPQRYECAFTEHKGEHAENVIACLHKYTVSDQQLNFRALMCKITNSRSWDKLFPQLLLSASPSADCAPYLTPFLTPRSCSSSRISMRATLVCAPLSLGLCLRPVWNQGSLTFKEIMLIINLNNCGSSWKYLYFLCCGSKQSFVMFWFVCLLICCLQLMEE